ncbi:MAG TPA: uracil-DNA glycosylase [Verrucomicrobiae bacterium]|nr:uracil-DNA glycosylase [Verrucomicrobiae bacterium]
MDALGLEPWARRGTSTARSAAETASPPVPVIEPPEIREPAVAAKPAAAMAVTPGARSWGELRAAVAACRRCRLCETRSNTVFGVGPLRAPLMVVGEGPGADEDARGEPFVGRAGKLLDEMLRAIGRSRETDTFIANVVKCRPPGNREPADDEAEACRAYLEQQLELVQPRLILALGRIAAQRLLASDTPIGKMRGQNYTWGPRRTPLMVTYHPAYLLRNPADKAKSWEDLKRVHRFITGAGA